MSNFNLLNLTNSQTLTLGANAAATSAIIPQLRFRLMPQVNCHIAIGTGPTATTSSVFVCGGQISPEFDIPMNNKVSVLNATSTADAKVTIFY